MPYRYSPLCHPERSAQGVRWLIKSEAKMRDLWGGGTRNSIFTHTTTFRDFSSTLQAVKYCRFSARFARKDKKRMVTLRLTWRLCRSGVTDKIIDSIISGVLLSRVTRRHCLKSGIKFNPFFCEQRDAEGSQGFCVTKTPLANKLRCVRGSESKVKNSRPNGRHQL
jgi:hypothetical protein